MIFDVNNNGEPVITPEGLNIPEFTAIWKADKSKGKDKARAEFVYVYHMVHPKSSYAKLSESDKEKTIKNDYMKNLKEWVPSDLVYKAMGKLKLLTETPALRLLNAAEGTCDKLAQYFTDVDLTMADPETINKTITSLKGLSPVVKSINDLKKLVQMEEDSSDLKVRGGATFGFLEDEDED